MIWLPLIGFLLGFCAILFSGVTVPSEYASYLSLAAIAGIDTILGGIRSGLEGQFKNDVFLSGFVVNTILAVMIAYFGDLIGVSDLYLAAVVVLGGRIFLNLSIIRRHFLGRPHSSRTTLEMSRMGASSNEDEASPEYVKGTKPVEPQPSHPLTSSVEAP